jgi:plastocyanin domain-containing protein
VLRVKAPENIDLEELNSDYESGGYVVEVEAQTPEGHIMVSSTNIDRKAFDPSSSSLSLQMSTDLSIARRGVLQVQSLNSVGLANLYWQGHRPYGMCV